MNLILIASFPFILATSNELPNLVEENAIADCNGSFEYCNERYKFCISYPDNFFDEKELADNGDGISLYENDKNVDFKVFGSFNVMDWTLEDIYYFSMEDFVKNEQEVKNLDQKFEDYAYETTFLADGKLYYYKTYLLDDAYVSLTLTLPADAMETLDQLKEDIDFFVNV